MQNRCTYEWAVLWAFTYNKTCRNVIGVDVHCVIRLLMLHLPQDYKLWEYVTGMFYTRDTVEVWHSFPGFHWHRWRQQVEAMLHSGRRSAADWLLLWCFCSYRRSVWYVGVNIYICQLTFGPRISKSKIVKLV